MKLLRCGETQTLLLLVTIIFSSHVIANINNNPAPNIVIGNNVLFLRGIDTEKLNVDEQNDDYNHLALLAQDEEMLKETFGSFTGWSTTTIS
jgi:hypothetical protein